VPELESSTQEDLVQYVQQLVSKSAACGHSNSSPAEGPSSASQSEGTALTANLRLV
jgi:hypothetical protein